MSFFIQIEAYENMKIINKIIKLNLNKLVI